MVTITSWQEIVDASFLFMERMDSVEALSNCLGILNFAGFLKQTFISG